MGDSNSPTTKMRAPTRFVRSLLVSLPFVVGFWFLRRSWRDWAVVAIGFCCLAVYQTFSDRLSLRSRFLVVLPLFIGLVVGILLVS
jgi:hypothetical protein